MKRQTLLPGLTGLRFPAAMMVFVFHFGASMLERIGASTYAVQFARNGYMGVTLFFILSGFIICYSYQERLNNKDQRINYIIARLARIYPLYLLALLITVPALPRPIDLSSAIKVIFMMQAWYTSMSLRGFEWFSPAWTISVEIFFYFSFLLISPWLGAGKRWSSYLMMIGLSVCIVTLTMPMIVRSEGAPVIDIFDVQISMTPIYRLPEFLLGVSLYRWTQLHPKYHRFISTPIPVAMTLACILVVMCTLKSGKAMGLLSLLFALLIIQAAYRDSSLSKLLSFPVMTTLGCASFAIYLLQAPVRGLCTLYLPSPYIRPAHFLATMCGAVVVFRYFEEPIRRSIQKIAFIK